MNDILFDIGAILWLFSLAACVEFFIGTFKSDKKKMAINFYLMLILVVLGAICRYYKAVMNITLGIGALCLIVIELLIVLVTAFGLYVLIKDVVHRVRPLCKRRTAPLVKIKIKRKRQEHIVSEIPDDSFFEIPLPPGGIE